MKVQIKIEGYGLEIALGRIEQEVLDYFVEKNVSLTNFVNGDIEVPEKYRPFESEAWFECDDIVHVHGLQLENDGKIIISEGSQTLAEFNATYDELAENDIEFEIFFILKRISRTFGPQFSISTSKVSTLGFCFVDGSHL